MTAIFPYAMVLRPLREIGEIGGARLESLLSDGADGYQLLCPKCSRNPQISGTRFEGALERLRAAGITEVDISRLPF